MSEPALPTLRVAVGIETFPPGRTSLEIFPDGRYLVINRRRALERRFEGHLDAARVHRLLTDAAAAAFWTANVGTRKGDADEPRYRLELHADHAAVRARDIWRSELAVHKDAAALVKAFEELAREAEETK